MGACGSRLGNFGAIGAVYGALSDRQKTLNAWLPIVRHMGYVLLGAAAATQVSLVGAVAQMVAHGLILAILFHLVGVIETKVGTLRCP